MVIFNTDLDNTIIYSYKHNIGSSKICVEVYNGRSISFITEKTYRLLKKVTGRALIVPVTTRTIEQYNRIDLGTGGFRYVLACNGGVLLVDGKEDREWYQKSLELVHNSAGQLEKAFKILEADRYRTFETRNIKGLFLFTKSRQPEITKENLKQNLDLSAVDILTNGIKVYVVPKNLDKGTGVKRFKEKTGGEVVIAAGDSLFDVPMLECADYAIAPPDLSGNISKGSLGKTTITGKGDLFSEKLLERVIEITGM